MEPRTIEVWHEEVTEWLKTLAQEDLEWLANAVVLLKAQGGLFGSK